LMNVAWLRKRPDIAEKSKPLRGYGGAPATHAM
jgi:hypothetical protein